MSQLKNQPCHFCKKKTLTLTEETYNVPHFGKCFLMSMNCSSCNFNKTDVESEERKPPSKQTFTLENKKDLNTKVIKSSEATVKIPQLRMDVRPGVASSGYLSNLEGVLLRFKKIIEKERDSTDDPKIRKHAKNLLKKLWKAELGDLPLKIVIEDPSGNSAIVSEKTEVKKLK
jgi:zinc finger protein